MKIKKGQDMAIDKKRKLEIVATRKKLRPLEKAFIFAVLVGPVIHFLVFWVGVNINSILMAFQLPTGGWSLFTLELVFKNIKEGGDLLIAIKNTFIYFSISVITIPFHVIIVYFFFRKIRAYRFFQVVFYLPSIISTLIICQMFQDIIKPEGPIGLLLAKVFQIDEIPYFLQNSQYAMKTMVVYTLWTGWGGNMLLLGGALARIPIETLEAGRIDGVNTFQELAYMIFPLLWPTISTFLILAMTGILTASGPILAMTKGDFNTTTISYWIYDKMYYTGTAAYNEVAATGLVFTVIGVPIILLLRYFIEKIPVSEY